jgi:ABC-type lipoprotein release transport system permease subunit
MSQNVTQKYAIRSLFRHKRRTVLSVLGIGLGVAVCLTIISLVRGERKMIMRAAAECGAGHLCIVPEEWRDTRENSLRLDNWEAIREQVAAVDNVRMVTPRSRCDTLLAFGTRLTGVVAEGIDPNTEQQANRLVSNVIEGRYLKPGERNTTVVGSTIAERFRVEIGDPLMVTVSDANGDIQGALWEIVGILTTGSSDMDSTICQVSLEEMEKMTGLPGAGELVVLVDNPRRLTQTAEEIRRLLPEGTIAMTWDEIRPELAAGVKVDETWSRVVIAVVITVVFLGIASSQLAAVLERRREFAVLSALGMRSRALIRVMLTEGLILGFFGALLGLFFGVPVNLVLATRGLDFSKVLGDADMSFSNVILDPVFHGDFGWYLVPMSLWLSLTATLLSSLYPAWYASKLDPATALRVDH